MNKYLNLIGFIVVSTFVTITILKIIKTEGFVVDDPGVELHFGNQNGPVLDAQNQKRETNRKLFEDHIFDDVVVYYNDQKGRSGLDRCLDNKCGRCVEFGLTGDAYYYPCKSKVSYSDVQDQDFTTDEQFQSLFGKVDYVGFR